MSQTFRAMPPVYPTVCKETIPNNPLEQLQIAVVEVFIQALDSDHSLHIELHIDPMLGTPDDPERVYLHYEAYTNPFCNADWCMYMDHERFWHGCSVFESGFGWLDCYVRWADGRTIEFPLPYWAYPHPDWHSDAPHFDTLPIRDVITQYVRYFNGMADYTDWEEEEHVDWGTVLGQVPASFRRQAHDLLTGPYGLDGQGPDASWRQGWDRGYFGAASWDRTPSGIPILPKHHALRRIVKSEPFGFVVTGAQKTNQDWLRLQHAFDVGSEDVWDGTGLATVACDLFYAPIQGDRLDLVCPCSSVSLLSEELYRLYEEFLEPGTHYLRTYVEELGLTAVAERWDNFHSGEVGPCD